MVIFRSQFHFGFNLSSVKKQPNFVESFFFDWSYNFTATCIHFSKAATVIVHSAQLQPQQSFLSTMPQYFSTLHAKLKDKVKFKYVE